MKLPGFLTPLGIILGAATLLVVAGLIVFGGQRLFSPGPLSEVNRSGERIGDVLSHADPQVECADCHTAPWSVQSMSDRCAACHTEIAKERNDPNRLHGVINATNCRDCHVEHRGKEGVLTVVDQLNVDHELFGFSLAAHKKKAEGDPFACADCHTERLTTFAPERCVECHREQDETFVASHIADVGNSCRDCHDGSDTFSADRFDHNLLAFPLTGAHAQTTCADCHTGARALADYADAPTECADCHLKASPHPANFGQDCARCHTTDGWQTQIFDHDLASFKLEGNHAEVACADCHQNDILAGTPTDCVACHVEDDPHSLMLGAECADCHTPADWKPATFDHAQTGYLLTGKHQQVACADCHVDDIFAGTPRDCVSCHLKDDFHAGQYGTDCAACHTTDGWPRPAFVHTFPLDHGGGGIIPCATCHTEPPNYKVYTCYNCHDPDIIRIQHPFAAMMGTDITNCVRCHPTGQLTMRMY